MAKAKANMHKPFVDAFLKVIFARSGTQFRLIDLSSQYYHVQVSIATPDEIDDDIIQAKLKAAGGAHYGVGQGGGVSGGGENFSGIKDNVCFINISIFN